MPYGVEHTPDLPVSALAKRQFDDPRAALLTAPNKLRLGRCGYLALADRQTFGKRLDRLFGRLALHGRLIQLAKALARVGHPVNKVAVVGQQDQPFRVRIQSSCRDQTNTRNPNEIRDLLFRMSIRDRGHVTDGLVQRDVIPPCAGRVDRPAVHGDPLCVRVRHRAGRGDDLVVDTDSTGGDNLLGATTRGDSGGGDYFLQALLWLRLIGGRLFHTEMLPEEGAMRRK